MTTVLAILLIVAALIQLVCWAWTVGKAFQNKEVVLGIVSLCTLVGFIVGWVKHKEWRHTNVMLWWTAAMLVYMLCQGLHVGVHGHFHTFGMH